jgi:hypothetical protein
MCFESFTKKMINGKLHHVRLYICSQCKGVTEEILEEVLTW